MAVLANIVQLVFTPLMLITISIFQLLKIRTLSDQLKGHKELLNSVKTYFDILNPEMFKQRVELYEKIVEKEMKMNLEKMESELLKTTKSMKTTQTAFVKSINSAVKGLAESFVFLPNSQRVRIVNEMKDDFLKDILKDTLPGYKEIDARMRKELTLELLAQETN